MEKVIVHENYLKDSWHTSNDIALIRLTKPVELSVNVIPVCLPLNKVCKKATSCVTNLKNVEFVFAENNS